MYKILVTIFKFFVKVVDAITFYKLPLTACVCTVVSQNNKFLVQNRAEGNGYCLPGGFSKYGEIIEKAAIREVKEETGLDVSDLKFLFYVNPTGKYKRNLTLIFEGDLKSGDLKDSWEGRAEWKSFEELNGHMAFD